VCKGVKISPTIRCIMPHAGPKDVFIITNSEKVSDEHITNMRLQIHDPEL
jgi:hypothetical protein